MKSIRIVAAMALLLPVVCHATLGAAPSSSAGVPAASASSRAALTAAASSAPYTIHETRTADGVTVREYESAAHVVFAVTWQGPTRPDMQALLGSYFPDLVAAGQRVARGTGPLIARTSDLQIESVGHQGAFAGRACVPRLVPANVNVDALQ
ncbi:DUF2844 domain-containing protein [Paraburkholderia phymatum]|uniref:DUF2844 domain-containing protein n=1 Tax=Paraburkholderia phymatum (strain DSM 17167 / CIP 108236 / LMG 21445 / STM815) TaxID=391038 RepID=B2JEV8_PARP8|nr:DUF2844 domain-containing protein [Paraburkholderia phymatum]ACC71423.1 conserved hypothetical protein [Paraburkholderia phymatum STM815]